MTSGLQAPRYSVHFYRDNVYKLIRFKRPLLPHIPGKCQDRGEEDFSGEKFSQALSRAKSVVYQVGFCNDWDFFFTGTISPAWRTFISLLPSGFGIIVKSIPVTLSTCLFQSFMRMERGTFMVLSVVSLRTGSVLLFQVLSLKN